MLANKFLLNRLELSNIKPLDSTQIAPNRHYYLSDFHMLCISDRFLFDPFDSQEY
jgi:hypothetical protein